MEGRTVVAAVLGSPLSETRFASGKNLLRYGLENFTAVDLAKVVASNTFEADITGSKETPAGTLKLPVQQVPQKDSVLVERNVNATQYTDASHYVSQVKWKDDLAAPITAGEVLGTVRLPI